MLILYYGAAITDREANFVELGHVETYSGYLLKDADIELLLKLSKSF